jgi:glycosyltransferase involved in cell wall biosynthesis
MKVAYDAGPLLGTPTGVGRYAKELAGALTARGVELQRYAISFGAPRDDSVRRWKLPARIVQRSWLASGRPVPRSLFEGCDVVHATNFVLPPTGGKPGVVTVHDLSFHRDDVFPGGARLRSLVPWSLEHAAAVVVPTEAIALELSERHDYPSDRISVTHEGVAPTFFGTTPLSELALGRMGIPGPFVLAVGTLEPRKNLFRLLKAWQKVGKQLQGWRLVLAGPKGWGPELPETEGVMPIGYVDDHTLPGLMAAAELFCYPSLYEGFGLPPLEAMAAGTACVVGRYAAAAEVLGDSAVLVDPTEVEELAEALGRLAGDPTLRRQLGLEGRARAALYTWEATAQQTKKVYERVAST